MSQTTEIQSGSIVVQKRRIIIVASIDRRPHILWHTPLPLTQITHPQILTTESTRPTASKNQGVSISTDGGLTIPRRPIHRRTQIIASLPTLAIQITHIKITATQTTWLIASRVVQSRSIGLHTQSALIFRGIDISRRWISLAPGGIPQITHKKILLQNRIASATQPARKHKSITRKWHPRPILILIGVDAWTHVPDLQVFRNVHIIHRRLNAHPQPSRLLLQPGRCRMFLGGKPLLHRNRIKLRQHKSRLPQSLVAIQILPVIKIHGLKFWRHTQAIPV